MGVKFVTDSAQDFEPAFLEAKGISVVPLTVHFGEESYLDGYEMRSTDFYTKLKTSKDHPRTSQPSPGAFQDVFKKLSEDGSEVIAILLSSALSGTYQAATIARDALPDRKIHVVDSKSASAGYGIMVLKAVDMASSGKSAEEILSEIEWMKDNIHVVFSVDTLDYLARNGRIGKALHLLGTLLNMKPILSLDKEGAVIALERVRGKNKVIGRMVEILQERVPTSTRLALGICNAEAAGDASKLKSVLSSIYDVKELYETEIGSIIGTHTGPGTLAVFVLPYRN